MFHIPLYRVSSFEYLFYIVKKTAPKLAKYVFLRIMRLHQQHHHYKFKAERVEQAEVKSLPFRLSLALATQAQ